METMLKPVNATAFMKNSLAALLVVLPGVIFLLLFDRAFVDPSNHIGFSPWYALVCIPVGTTAALLSCEEFVRKGLPEKPFVMFNG